jgi:c-di-GMP-binding flagellar brake protein YcgR
MPISTDNASKIVKPVDTNEDAYSKYLLFSRAEILYVLRAITQKGSLVTVTFDAGNQFFLTSLLTLSSDGNWLYFDPGSDQAVNQRALKASRLAITTTLDKVKIQFSVDGLHTSEFHDRPAFAAKTPETLLRLQRREYYRLSTPIAAPLTCRFSLPDGAPTKRHEGSVVDISGGGIGLSLPTADTAIFPTGTLLKDCRIELPEEGLLETELCVRNAFTVSAKSGIQHARIGCEYVDLPGTRLSMIQRYITRVERERKAREAGLE